MSEMFLRTVFFYFFIVFAYRIMGKREVGQLGIIDLIVSILIAELVALSIEKTDQSIFMAIIPISVLVVIEVVLGYLSVKSRLFNKIFGGKVSILINDGKIVYKNLVTQRYSIDDLLLALRKNEISSIEDVQYAFLEPNGELSIFKYKLFGNNEFPLPIVIEGTLQKDNLKIVGKSEKWLFDLLEKNNLKLNSIFYAIYKKSHVYLIKRS